MKKQYLLLLSALLATANITYGGGTPFLQSEAEKEFSGGTILGVDWFPPIPGTEMTNPARIAYVGANNVTEIRVGYLKVAEGLIVTKEEKKSDIYYVNGVAWLHAEKRFIATAGFHDGLGDEIAIYQYNNQSLTKKDTADMPEALAVDWIQINGESFLAVGGYDDYKGGEVRVYHFEDENHLTLCPDPLDEYFHGYADSVRWLTFFDGEVSHYYLAVGGFEQGVSIVRTVRVYEFDPIACTLTLLATDPFHSGIARSVDWLVDGDTMYLAAGGYDAEFDEEIVVYLFDGVSLTNKDTETLSNGTAHSVAWLSFGGVNYLAVGGDDGVDAMEVRLYTFDGTTLTFATSLSLGDFIPNSLRWQIIDGVPYLAVGGAFADKPLKIFSLRFNVA
jgi:WD40 repeat protein